MHQKSYQLNISCYSHSHIKSTITNIHTQSHIHTHTCSVLDSKQFPSSILIDNSKVSCSVSPTKYNNNNIIINKHTFNVM